MLEHKLHVVAVQLEQRVSTQGRQVGGDGYVWKGQLVIHCDWYNMDVRLHDVQFVSVPAQVAHPLEHPQIPSTIFLTLPFGHEFTHSVLVALALK